ncbi:hypothetical protein Tco_1465759 [Tanacetum coccineum]
MGVTLTGSQGLSSPQANGYVWLDLSKRYRRFKSSDVLFLEKVSRCSCSKAPLVLSSEDPVRNLKLDYVQIQV